MKWDCIYGNLWVLMWLIRSLSYLRSCLQFNGYIVIILHHAYQIQKANIMLTLFYYASCLHMNSASWIWFCFMHCLTVLGCSGISDWRTCQNLKHWRLEKWPCNQNLVELLYIVKKYFKLWGFCVALGFFVLGVTMKTKQPT